MSHGVSVQQVEVLTICVAVGSFVQLASECLRKRQHYMCCQCRLHNSIGIELIACIAASAHASMSQTDNLHADDALQVT